MDTLTAEGQIGFHHADLSSPIGPHTWEAAFLSAQTAAHAASLVNDGEKAVTHYPVHRVIMQPRTMLLVFVFLVIQRLLLKP